MKVTQKYVLTLVVLLAGGGMWWLTQDDEVQQNQDSELVHTINECDGIAEKAAANLVAIVEFQKLEIIGRKANVFKTCMKDRGYKENPDWTNYAEPIVQQTAKSTNISVDEAFENLRRADMIVTTQGKSHPSFWVQSKHD